VQPLLAYQNGSRQGESTSGQQTLNISAMKSVLLE